MPDIKFDEQVVKLADIVNRKRRQELISVIDNTSTLKALNYIRQQQIYDKGNKSKSMRKIASIPLDVDRFFAKLYGEDYYQIPDFFTKVAPEWAVIDHKKIYSRPKGKSNA